MTSTCAIQGLDPRRGSVASLLWVYPFQLLWVYLGHAQLGWVDLDRSIFAQNTQFFCSENDEFCSENVHFWPKTTGFALSLAVSWPSLAEIGPNPDPVDGNTPSLTTDEPFEAKLAPQTSPDPSRPPRTPPGGFGNKLQFFSNLLGGLSGGLGGLFGSL